ncbi:hypothetical protein, partial [Bartonella sp. 220B]|uniref:hypothetical protein n=1 Tax=Bartonella sp. 220B TaxID=2967260 RepID=UPI0022A97F30
PIPALGGIHFCLTGGACSVFSDVIKYALPIIKNPAFAGVSLLHCPSFRYNTSSAVSVIKYDLQHIVNNKITHIDRFKGNQYKNIN